MVEQNPKMRDAVEDILRAAQTDGLSQVAELIKSRELSRAMADLNTLLIEGTPSEQEEARQAVERLGFVAD